MLGNRIEQTSTTTGTGTYSLTGTVADRNSFIGAPPNGFATGSTVFYTAIDKTNGGWEVGLGVVTDLATDTLSRVTIIGSSNGGLAVNWAAGTRNIYNDVPSELFGPMGGRLLKGAVGGSANAITVTCAVPLRTLTDGAIVYFETGGADSSSAITVNVDGTGAVALRDSVGTAFSSIYVLKAAQKMLAMYSAATGFWHVLSGLGPASSIDAQTFTASGTWTKPAGNPKRTTIECWGAGGSGARRAAGNASGGGGGTYVVYDLPTSLLGATETVTIGTGGAARTGSDQAGAAGGNTTFGSWVTAYGGGAGQQVALATSVSGGGGGGLSVGANGASGGNASGGTPSDGGGLGGGQAVATSASLATIYGGGGGGGIDASNSPQLAASAVMGGGGGGATSSSGPATNSPGTSKGGGNGGAAGGTGTAGSQPGGGGGGAQTTSGAGGDGKCVVTTYF